MCVVVASTVGTVGTVLDVLHPNRPHRLTLFPIDFAYSVASKVGYLYGRGDLTHKEVSKLMGISLRGEITPLEALSPPTLSTAYQTGIRKGKKYY
jgi:hypothetical protein